MLEAMDLSISVVFWRFLQDMWYLFHIILGQSDFRSLLPFLDGLFFSSEPFFSFFQSTLWNSEKNALKWKDFFSLFQFLLW